jgi:TonB family protein
MTATAAVLEAPTRESGVPAAVLISITLHVAGMLAFFRMGTIGPKVDEVTIDNVDILVEEQKSDPAKPKPAQRRRAQRQKLAKNFLKLALPSMPKPRGPLQVKAPQIEKRLMEIPTEQLRDRGRMKKAMKMESLDLSKRRAGLAKIQAPLVESTRKAPAALPQLALVGRKRASRKVIQLDALRERTGAPAMQSMKGVGSIDLGAARRKFEAQGLNEAAPTARSGRKKSLADMLTSERPALDMGPRAVAVARKKPVFEDIAKPLPKREAVKTIQDAPQAKKKAVEIEGEIENRRVLGHSLPRFPQWAVDQGLIEAEVRIKFYVGASGAVLDEGMRVEQSSGYGRLDRLAMAHLKKWRFESRPFGSKNEYGIITFRFLLE